MARHLVLGTFGLLALLGTRDAVRVGPAPGGGHVVPTRQLIRPAGDTVEFPGRPVDLVLAPGGGSLYVKDNRGLVVIDLAGWRARQELPFPAGGGSMHGIAVSGDGKRLYLTSAQNHLYEARINPSGAAEWVRTIALPGPRGAGASHGCGIALSRDETTAYVCLSRNNALGVVDLNAGKVVAEIPVGIAPFDVALSPDGETAYVSNWGGRHPRPGERTAPSSGTETPVDERGVASTGSVSFVDLRVRRERQQVATDLHPSDLELHPDARTLFVANANSDTVSVIDVSAGRLLQSLSVLPDAALPFGSQPNAVALGRDGKTLFVGNGGNNAVAVASLGSRRGRSKWGVRGFLPAGWYPGGVVTDGRYIYVANVKGIGSRTPQPGQKGWHVYSYRGSVNRVPIPNREALSRYTTQVRADGRVPQILRAWESSRSDQEPVPVPQRQGEPSVFRHVVYVIKENRTYDQVFGDMGKGDGARACASSAARLRRTTTPWPSSSCCWTTSIVTASCRRTVTPRSRRGT